MVEQLIHSRLLNATKLLASDTALLREDLIAKKIDDLRKIMSSLSVCLAPPVRRKSSIGLLEWHIHNLSEEDDVKDVIATIQASKKVKCVLRVTRS